MKRYNFDEIVDRKDTFSCKWDVKDDEIPLSIADQDLITSDPIIECIKERTLKGCFGYTYPDIEFFNAYINFFKDVYSLQLKKEWMMFSIGVVPTISSTVRKLTSIGDNIVVLSPVYNIFYNSILNNSRKVCSVPLIYEDGNCFIDFTLLEKVLKDKKTTLLIFCNPHNPTGKIWSKVELYKLIKLCKENDVIILSDEIHGMITRGGIKYNPILSIEESKDITVVATSISKAFNVAGIQSSIVIVPDEELRKKVNRQINTDEVAEPNVFACEVAKAALNESRDYLLQLNDYLFSNRDFVCSFIEKNMPLLKAFKADATYLLWIDISSLNMTCEDFVSYLKKNSHVILIPGSEYGIGGKNFVRMNLAYSKIILKNALTRMKKSYDLLLKNIEK